MTPPSIHLHIPPMPHMRDFLTVPSYELALSRWERVAVAIANAAHPSPTTETREVTADPTTYNTGYRMGRADAIGFRDKERLERDAYKQGFEAGRSDRTGLNPTEAALCFASWLTGREETTHLGASRDAAPVAELIDRYRIMQGWPLVRPGFERHIVPPQPVLNPTLNGLNRPLFPSEQPGSLNHLRTQQGANKESDRGSF